MSGTHGNQITTDGIHIPYNWSFADSTARAVTTDPKTNASYSSNDIGKLALQEDDNSLWLLSGTTPTWVGVSVNSEGGVINYTATMGNSTKDPTTDAPTDWLEIKIGGTTYYLPAYIA